MNLTKREFLGMLASLPLLVYAKNKKEVKPNSELEKVILKNQKALQLSKSVLDNIGVMVLDFGDFQLATYNLDFQIQSDIVPLGTIVSYTAPMDFKIVFGSVLSDQDYNRLRLWLVASMKAQTSKVAFRNIDIWFVEKHEETKMGEIVNAYIRSIDSEFRSNAEIAIKTRETVITLGFDYYILQSMAVKK